MNLRELLGDLAANVAAGFAEELADAIKEEAKALPNHAAARGIGHEIASELLAGSRPPPLTGELLDPEPPPQLIERPLIIDGRPIEVTPEMLQAYIRLQQQGKIR